MKRYENECVGCSSVGLYCMGSACPNRHVLRFYCDDCGEEIDIDSENLYEYSDDIELCEECLLKRFKLITRE